MEEKKALPDGIEWPRFTDGEPVRFGDMGLDVHGRPRPVMSVKFTQAGLTFIGDGMGGTWWGNDTGPMEDLEVDRGKRVKRPAPKVLDADGAEVHKGDEVWSTTGEFDGKRTVSSVHIDPDEPPYAMFEERQKPYSCLCCYLTHRAPVIAADGEPLKVGQTVWHTKTGTEYRVLSLPDGERGAWLGNSDGKYFLDYAVLTHQRPVLDADGVPIKVGDTVYLLPGEWCGEFPLCYYSAGDEMVVRELCPDHGVEGVLMCVGEGKFACFPLPFQLTHTKPEPDSWSSVWADVSDGHETPEGMMRRCRALAERGE